MFLAYPIPPALYLIAAAIALLAFFPRLILSALANRWTWIIGALVIVAGMLLIPSKNYLMGDGLTHLGNPGRVFSSTEPLDIFLHHVVYLVVGSSTIGYRVVSFVAGLFYLWGLFLFSRFATSSLEKGIIVLAFLCTATVQFYFGHVESYTLVNLFTFYYIYFVWRDSRNNRQSQVPLLFFLLALLSHFSAIVYVPSLVYLYRRQLRIYHYVLIALVVAAGVVVAFTVNISIIMVPLLANSFSSYSLFSIAHILDLAAILLLVSPAFYLAFRKSPLDRLTIFLLLALAGALFFTVVTDPKIGAFRDWDLLSIFAVPLAALIALRAPRKPVVVVVLAVTIIVRIIPWLLFNSKSQIEFIKSTVAADVHYSERFDKGQRLLSWGTLLQKNGDMIGAEEAWLRRLQYDPDHLNALTMLAPLEFRMGKFKEAHEAYLKLLRLQPSNLDFHYKSAYTAFRMGDNQAALRILADAPEEFRNNPTTIRLYAGIAAKAGNHQQAVELIERAPALDTHAYLSYVLAYSCLQMRKLELARQLINRAIELDSTNEEYRHLEAVISTQK